MEVADIARIALTAVSGAITDAVHAGVLSPSVESIGKVYDVQTGRSLATDSNPATYACRVLVETDTPPRRVFPEYDVAAGDQMVFIEGAGAEPVENWTLTFGGRSYTILRVQDILGAGTTFRALVRAEPGGEDFA